MLERSLGVEVQTELARLHRDLAVETPLADRVEDAHVVVGHGGGLAHLREMLAEARIEAGDPL